MNILVINCGSSSLKFQLINADNEKLIAKGLCERIGIEGSRISYTPDGGEKEEKEAPMGSHTDAIRLVLDALTNEKTGVVKELRNRQAFEKPSVAKRKQTMRAVYVQQLQQVEE